jgi:hypothetical protein
VDRRLSEILTGADQSTEFAHLSADDRLAIRDILLETHPERFRSIEGVNSNSAD